MRFGLCGFTFAAVTALIRFSETHKLTGLREQMLGLLFFAVHVLNAFSHLGAAWIAQRIGW
jgi:hypothetical protein